MPKARNRTPDLDPIQTYRKKPRDISQDWPMPPKAEVKEEEPKVPVVTPKTGKSKK